MDTDLPVRFLDPDDWAVQAACRGRPDLFFAPDTLESRTERRERELEAKAVCGTCYVRTLCLSEAIARAERFGIWGGLTARERRSYLKEHTSPHDIAGPGRLARLPAVVVQGRQMSPDN